MAKAQAGQLSAAEISTVQQGLKEMPPEMKKQLQEKLPEGGFAPFFILHLFLFAPSLTFALPQSTKVWAR